MSRGEFGRRVRLAGAFALLLAACVTVPVLAQWTAPAPAGAEISGAPEGGGETAPSPEPSPEGEPPSPEGEPEPPEAPQEEAGLEAEGEREADLDSPQAAAERESSEFAYANLTPAQEEALLREHFSAQLQAIDADPARALADVVLKRIDSPTEAVVTVDGENVLLESEVPLRAPEEDGDLHKVELELEESADGFEPANPLVDLSLPETASDSIELGDEGLAITPVGTSDAAASLLGEEDLFLPAAREDTSLLLSPIAGGVELSALLVSRNSPQQLAFDVNLPQGASLRSSATGGAEVVDADQNVIAVVTAPRALDAQGTEVPVTLSVQGSILAISAAHHEMDVAYPLFVDPQIIEENWSGFADTSKLNYWNWSYGGVGPEDFIGQRWCIVTCWGNGLYLRGRSNFTYPAGSWARWWFTPQGTTTYMRRVVLGPINYDAQGCWANEPHPYVGVWNDYSGWVVLSNAYPTGFATYVDTGSQNLGPGSRTAFVGIHAGGTVKLNCGRDYRLGGATLFLDDPEPPTAGATWGYPTGWVKSGASFTINAPASDPGLGVYEATLYPKEAPTIIKKHGCDAHYSNPCPANHTFQFPVSAASFDEGEKTVEFKVRDGIEKPSNTHVWTMKVDRTPPQVNLAGQLAMATGETEGDAKDQKDRALALPVYNLQINTTDGRVGTTASPLQPGEKRSGVKKIQVFLDNRPTPEATWEATSCAAGNCPLNKTFALKLNELSGETDHYLRILATDFAGNAPRERKVEFEFIPATGMKEEYVMQYFPLPDGSGSEAEEENPRRPELAVNLVNGNLVYRQRDVEVEEASAELEVERYYNSLLPEAQDTEWGDGWTMGQEPALEIDQPASGPPTEATIVEETGGVESKLDLPTSVGGESFDKTIQATVIKEPGGGYEVRDETGETGDSLSFSPSGQLDEAGNGTAATVEYDYESGELSEIAIEDPGTANVAPGSIEEDEVFPDLAVSHSANLGTAGTGDGQFDAPADVVTDAQGNLYVLDRGNGRIQKLGPDGQFLSKFGAPGTADGQLSSPRALAIDASGNILVADANRVQKFSPSGQFLSKFGTAGEAPGQFTGPKAIAVGVDGSIWVGDAYHLQRFTSAGQFIERVRTWTFPLSLDADAKGNMFVGEEAGSWVAVYSKEGDLLRKFGSAGTGLGQFSRPTEVSVDPDGNVWVADDAADRVQLFNNAGDYIAKFASPGTGAQQLQLESRTGIVAEENGRIWIADGGNDRVVEWLGGNFEPSSDPALTEDDPSLEIDVSEGLVESVEGDEAGTVTYDHSGDLLTAVDGPETQADYAYDSAGRMTKVTLATGTYAEIAYEATYGRVKSVKVAPQGANAKTTYFEYSDDPRRTTVTPADAPVTTYDFAADGSLFKWWNGKQPPIFDDIGGSLYDPNNRETAAPIAPGTYNLVTQPHSEEGIASIQVIANGNQLVSEKTCEQDPETPGIECRTPIDEWVTETSAWPPGIVHLEVVATDRLGQTVASRFWVNIPYTPPPDPEAEQPPRFSDVARFREEYGLDRDLKGDELAVNDRIFDLIGNWHNPMTPRGEVARATHARWGVPLREVEVAELEYRESYLAQAAVAIPQWVSANALTSSYAGYYVDHRQGGKIYVGFTSGNQTSLVAALSQSGSLAAPADRVTSFSDQPQHALEADLGSIATEIPHLVGGNTAILAILTKSVLDIKKNRIVIGTTNIASASTFFAGAFGSSAPIEFEFNSHKPIQRIRTRPKNNRLYAGDLLRVPEGNNEYSDCTLGFGASEKRTRKATGETLHLQFGLTAGHCWKIGTKVNRHAVTGGNGSEIPLGTVRRQTLEVLANGMETDGEAILLDSGFTPPQWIYAAANAQYRVTGAESPVAGSTLCVSGSYYERAPQCGVASAPFIAFPDEAPPIYVVQTSAFSKPGDSGGPVWNLTNGKAVGLIQGGYENVGPTWFTPLRNVALPNGQVHPGLLEQLDAPGGGHLNVSH
jgi:YD repeat-containing protein